MQHEKTRHSFFSRHKIFTLSAIGLASLPIIDISGITVDYATILFVTMYTVLGLGIWQITQDSSRGAHSKSLICFTIYAAFSAAGESFWMMCAKEMANTCYISEKLWLIALVPQVVFAVLYVKPFAKSISKKNTASAILAACCVFIPSMFYITQYGIITNDPDIFNVYLYTIFDTALIMVMTLGFNLFFRGRISFSWSLMLFGILSVTIGDFAFLNAMMNGSLFIDELENVFYVTGYALFVLGLYYRSRTFKDRFQNQELLR